MYHNFLNFNDMGDDGTVIVAALSRLNLHGLSPCGKIQSFTIGWIVN